MRHPGADSPDFAALNPGYNSRVPDAVQRVVQAERCTAEAGRIFP
jgi:hypothetical protein